MTPTEREEMELVAKVAGIEYEWEGDELLTPTEFRTDVYYWNPRTDDGDAFRLMVKMDMDINRYVQTKETSACQFGNGVQNRAVVKIDDDPYAATREAIFQCALECAKRRGK